MSLHLLGGVLVQSTGGDLTLLERFFGRLSRFCILHFGFGVLYTAIPLSVLELLCIFDSCCAPQLLSTFDERISDRTSLQTVKFAPQLYSLLT